MFQHMGLHKIFIPRQKARWWMPLEPPNSAHPMDKKNIVTFKRVGAINEA